MALTEEALVASWQTDRALLEADGFSVRVIRERRGIVEAEVSDATDRARLEWARDAG